MSPWLPSAMASAGAGISRGTWPSDLVVFRDIAGCAWSKARAGSEHHATVRRLYRSIRNTPLRRVPVAVPGVSIGGRIAKSRDLTGTTAGVPARSTCAEAAVPVLGVTHRMNLSRGDGRAETARRGGHQCGAGGSSLNLRTASRIERAALSVPVMRAILAMRPVGAGPDARGRLCGSCGAGRRRGLHLMISAGRFWLVAHRESNLRAISSARSPSGTHFFAYRTPVGVGVDDVACCMT